MGIAIKSSIMSPGSLLTYKLEIKIRMEEMKEKKILNKVGA